VKSRSHSAYRPAGIRFPGLPVRPAGKPGRAARRGRHLLGVLVLVRGGARPGDCH